MRKIRLEFIVIIFLLLMNTIQYMKNRHIREGTTINSEQLNENISNLSVALMSRCELESAGLTDSITLIDKSSSIVQIQNILDEAPHLFLYFSDKDCSSCIDHAMQQFSSFIDVYSSARVIILAQVSSIRAYILQIEKYDLDCASYFLESEPFNFSKLGSKPFFFIMNKELDPKLYFVPDKKLPDLTEAYLNIIGQMIN